MYDAIVVGARCAGSPTAMLLARRGYRVLLLDKATFPSDTMSTHYLQPAGLAALDRWGLLDELRASTCPPITALTMDFGGVVVPVPAGGDGLDAAYCPRRTVLDTMLVRAAVAAGAELREGFAVQELLFDGDTVTGVRGRTSGGDVVDERARIVVGADGKHSLVARAVDAPRYHERGSLGCGYYSYWSGLPLPTGTEVYFRDRRAVLAFATNDGLTCIGMEWPNTEFHEFRSDIDGNFMATLELAPAFAERVRAATREERWNGTADLPNFFRKPYGDGWALVGDAGYHKDPITGTGITDGFRDAELLAEAIDTGLSAREPITDALATYERRRDEAALPMYEITCKLASFTLSPMQVAQEMMSARPAPPSGVA